MAYAENTKVPLEQSIAEIIGMVRKAGAQQLGQFQERDRFLIMFTLGDRQMKFTVPLVTTYDGPLRSGNGRPVDAKARIEQMNRQKGRALMLVIKAKLESVESGVETFEQAFLANIVVHGGQTVYDEIRKPLALQYTEGKIAPLMLGGPQ